jgi:4-carboxymuconolactone decarboxylase
VKGKSTKRFLLPQIAAASALNEFELLRKSILKAKSKKIPFTKIYECLLQNYLFTGYPTALLSLKILKECYPKKKLPKKGDMNLYHFRKEGEINCKKVYGDKYEKLIQNISAFSPELSEWLVLEGYGKVFGRPGLTFKERELSIVAVLSVMKFEDQLYSHINGAVKSDASIDEIEAVIVNLNLPGKRKNSVLGLRVLNRYKKNRGMT